MENIIQDNQSVILYGSHEDMKWVTTKRGEIIQSRLGNFHFDGIIGKQFGSRIKDRKTEARSIVVLPGSPELRTLTLDYRTQVLYAPDLAYISSFLGLRSGYRLLEAGTGSASATVSFARTIGPEGRIYTFENNQERFEKNVEELATLGYNDRVVCFHRDVYEEGFGFNDGSSITGNGVASNSIDGAFIDLPQPWRVLDSLHETLKDQGTVAIFSPCSEQVNECAKWLRSKDYHGVECVEVLCKGWNCWTETDSAKRRHRAESSRKANLEAGRTSKEVEKLVIKNEARFNVRNYVLYQLESRGHTGYILTATKPPSDEEDFENPMSIQCKFKAHRN